MDAQHVEAAPKKPAASSKQAASELSTAANTNNNNNNNHNNSNSNSNQPKPSLNRKSLAAFKSSPNAKDSKDSSKPLPQDDDGGADANSEAETIVLAGKDDRSPIKGRKLIKHEAKSDGEDGGVGAAVPSRKQLSFGARDGRDSRDGADNHSRKSTPARDGAAGGDSTTAFKRKRLHGGPDGVKSRTKPDQCSSGLSSAPASPPHPHAASAHHSQQQQQQPRRRRLSSTRSAASDSESVRARSPRPPAVAGPKEKHRQAEKLVPHKRKAPKAESEDESESHKARRQRTSAADKDSGKTARDPTGTSGLNYNHTNNHNHGSGQGHSYSKSTSARSHHNETHASAARVRSVSPAPRTHRRSVSSQLPPPSSNGLSQKKKRVPAPLQATDYHSDDSSPGGSPRIRSSKLRTLTTPATAESNMSPAKMAPHKKHLDAHGQTFLARACARGEYDIAKQRLGERPEDLNVADFAGNTPLQIASINGYEDIVKLLIEAGCALDCVNYDKDTPLLDAVENGHVEVVKLLLDAGVNPRKANVNGEEPLDRITDETDNADEIRRLLIEAKQRAGERRRTSEEHNPKYIDGRESHGPESPRHSPATSNPQAAPSGRRAGTVRATKTSNHLLYMPMDDKTLRQAAGRGDEETVTRILQVRDTFDDPESMVAAARGGHDMIINLLLALGNANPDPAPVGSMPPEFATPMLAAIGQENIKVVELLLTQGNFDPTRRFKGEAYYEIARRRQGPNWKEEEHMLKEAYDAHKKTQKEASKTRSPATRDSDREMKRAGRPEPKDEPSRLHKRKLSSPSRDSKKSASNRQPNSPKEKRRSESFPAHRDDQPSPKRGPGRPKKEDRLPTIAVSDREQSPATSKQPKAKRAEPDISAISSEGEAVKPRRKLISGKDLKGEREKQRRASMVSTASSLKEPSSPRDGRDDAPDKPKSEKFLDRTKQLKRDESRDRLSVSSEGSAKRHRSSATPPHTSADKDGGDVPPKRRRLDVEGKEKRPKTTPTPDDRHSKSAGAREAAAKARRDHEDEDRREPFRVKKNEVALERGRRESAKSSCTEKSINVKSEDTDVEMRDASHTVQQAEVAVSRTKTDDQTARTESEARALAEAEARAQAEAQAQARAEAEALEEARRKEEEEDRRIAEEEKRKQQEERERRRREEEERRQREAEEAERRLKAEQEEKERRRKEEEEERKRLVEEEKKRKEEEAAELKRRKEEEERKRHEEEEKQRQAEAEAKRLRELEEERRRLEEEERKKREAEERQRREQLEREAAEKARRKREEEERKEQERLREQERRRAAREAEQRRLFLEQEALRLDKLPPLLRWLDGCPQPKTTEIAQKFATMQGVRYDCIRPETTGTPDGREQWLLNTQVALLLGEKDLKLSRYTAWERVPVSRIAKIMIWRIEADRYALTTPNLYDLGTQLPGYYGGKDPERLGYRTFEKLRQDAMERFLEMDMFFVKASELMFIVPNIPHLRNIRLAMAYRELPEDESLKWESCQKWKIDPDAHRFYGFAPGKKYYVNGAMVEEQMPGLSAVSKIPFPEHRVPRRGMVMVSRDDPDYARLCREQGLEHLLEGTSPTQSPLANGTSSPSTITSDSTALRLLSDKDGGEAQRKTSQVNGNPPDFVMLQQQPASVSQQATTATAAPEPKQDQPLVNGINGAINGAGGSN